jgi:hypothetical protein
VNGFGFLQHYCLADQPLTNTSRTLRGASGLRWLGTIFTIGWISPLPLEQEAARLLLDEEYPLEDVQHQNAFYLGGRIGQHEVVIGVQWRSGLSQAAILAEKMRAGFPNIQYFLLVGIAGAVPRYGPVGAVSDIVFRGCSRQLP